MDNHALVAIRDWITFAAELYICGILTVEYFYDFQKDLAKKQRKTKTTKKVTTEPSGISTTEETTETVSPMEEEKK